MIRHDCTVLAFSKAPVPGTVKTRLLPALNENEAARLYRELVVRTLDTVTDSRIAGWRVQLWCTPVTDHPFFVECRDKYGVELQLQARGDLGVRMHAAIAAAMTESDSVLLIGCDCPELQLADLVKARQELRLDADVVLGPSEDGGYYLIGMKTPQALLFQDIPWGGPTVLDVTRGRLRGRGLRSYELPLRWDLDDMVDLQRYRQMQERLGGADM